MPIFHLKPVLARLDDPAWQEAPYRGDCWVNAADEHEARLLVSGRYDNANINIGGDAAQGSPWVLPGLVACEQVPGPPDGPDIPNGVVVADRQF